MGNIFFEEINGWDSWSRVFQSIPAFKELIDRIFKKEHLRCGEISHLTAGSNAVFRAGDYVVKIFAPVESGLDTQIDYHCEVIGMQQAMGVSLHVPNVVSASSIDDQYLFRYIIMDYIDGLDANKVLKNYTDGQKRAFVRQLKEKIGRLNTPMEGGFPSVDVKERALVNERWNVLSKEVIGQVRERVTALDMPHRVYVHGDITGDNVMIDRDGTLYIIDFADARIAPKEYEYPPILFDLFDFDKGMVDEFIGSRDRKQFAEQCFNGILMHEFGVFFVKLICERLMGVGLGELDDILKIKEALADYIAG